MDINIKITVHMHMDDKLYDDPLVLGSDNYGIMGREITEPLREINGKEYCINNASDSFTINDLWDWIVQKLQEYKSHSESIDVRNSDKEIVSPSQIYLVFNGLRYGVEDTDKSLLYYIHRMDASETEQINVQILISANAGDVLRDNGIRYYMHSKEAGRHHEPHVHVDVKHEVSGTFSICSGKQLSGDKIRGKYLREIKQMILTNPKLFFEAWNLYTDGLMIDIDQALERKGY